MATNIDEIAFYERVAAEEVERLSRAGSPDEVETDSLSFKTLAALLKSHKPFRFLEQKELWIASTYDCLAEWEAYNFLAPLKGKHVLQVGGKGFAAVQFALVGAHAALLTPVAAEIRYAEQLARLANVKIECATGTAESIPFPDNSFDAIYTGGCAHHFNTPVAFPEIHRILAPGGRFAAVEPWKAPLYSAGIKIFGKREAVDCRPLERTRIEPLKVFAKHQVIHHGSITRYPVIALGKLGIVLGLNSCWTLTRADDFLCSLLRLRRFGSNVALLAEKSSV